MLIPALLLPKTLPLLTVRKLLASPAPVLVVWMASIHAGDVQIIQGHVVGVLQFHPVVPRRHAEAASRVPAGVPRS